MIQALPATFNGVLFRSRTEARWAVFMTELGIEWHYEHEAFALTSGNYLPDFWLPQLQISGNDIGCFIEIKGRSPTRDEGRLMHELADLTKTPVICLVGTPAEYARTVGESGGDPLFFCPGGGDVSYFWTVCLGCGVVGIEFDGRSSRVKHIKNCEQFQAHDDKGYNFDDPKILAAIQKSKEWHAPEGKR